MAVYAEGHGEDRAHGRTSRGAGVADEVYAALDLGTNNCRLLIAHANAEAATGFRVVDAFSRIVRLGEGLASSGRLSDAAMRRTLSALRICAGKMRRRGVTRARAVATAACRDAVNCEEFVARVESETGICLDAISGREEAHLAIHGCAPLIDPCRADALVFDIGGGSTEVSWLGIDPGDGALHLKDWRSIPYGVVSLAERYGGREVTRETFARMTDEVSRALAPFEADNGLNARARNGDLQMLGTSGTVTTLAGVHKRLARYDRDVIDGVFLDMPTVHATIDRVADMGYDERAAHGCIGRDRADLVIAGCAVLLALCRIWPVAGLRVADRGLREGILYNLMQPAGTVTGRDLEARAP